MKPSGDGLMVHIALCHASHTRKLTGVTLGIGYKRHANMKAECIHSRHLLLQHGILASAEQPSLNPCEWDQDRADPSHSQKTTVAD